ncbi:hypothetical protein [Chondromyces apiculatus]|uniref:hypothetical protein n=1 Tax=Chondromyces apiculatus TaxID=51 RepID=UPI0005C4BC28|nr:hypothetical protein [Chondromyces apiculatus]
MFLLWGSIDESCSVADLTVPTESYFQGLSNPSPQGIPGPLEGSPSLCARSWQGDILTGTARSDELLAIAIDEQGQILVAGYENGTTGVANVEPVGDAQGVVRKYSARGQLLWEHRIDTAGAETVEDLVLGRGGADIHVLGRTTGALGSFTNQGQFDVFVRTLDAHGKEQQTFQMGDERPQHPTKMALDATGALTIAGYDDLYVIGNYVAAFEDAFVLRLAPDAAGGTGQGLHEDWWYRYQTEGPDLLLGAAVDPAGTIFVAGIHGDPTPGGARVRMVGNDGTPGWTHDVSPIRDDVAYSVALSPAGDLYVSGATFLQLGDQQFGNQDMFVAKLDKDTGDVAWIAQEGWEDSEFPTAMTFDAEGNVYVAGTTFGGEDMGIFAMKLSPSGALLDTWRRDSAQDEEIWGAAVDACGRLFVVGYTQGELIPGTPNLGKRDAFLIKTDL